MKMYKIVCSHSKLIDYGFKIVEFYDDGEKYIIAEKEIFDWAELNSGPDILYINLEKNGSISDEEVGIIFLTYQYWKDTHYLLILDMIEDNAVVEVDFTEEQI